MPRLRLFPPAACGEELGDDMMGMDGTGGWKESFWQGKGSGNLLWGLAGLCWGKDVLDVQLPSAVNRVCMVIRAGG